MKYRYRIEKSDIVSSKNTGDTSDDCAEFEMSDGSESEFFRKQLEGIDAEVYKSKYPTYKASNSEMMSRFGYTHRKASLRERLAYKLGQLRERVGFWIAGHEPSDDDHGY